MLWAGMLGLIADVVTVGVFAFNAMSPSLNISPLVLYFLLIVALWYSAVLVGWFVTLRALKRKPALQIQQTAKTAGVAIGTLLLPLILIATVSFLASATDPSSDGRAAAIVIPILWSPILSAFIGSTTAYMLNHIVRLHDIERAA